MEIMIMGIILGAAAAIAKVTAPVLKPVPVKKNNR